MSSYYGPRFTFLDPAHYAASEYGVGTPVPQGAGGISLGNIAEGSPTGEEITLYVRNDTPPDVICYYCGLQLIKFPEGQTVPDIIDSGITQTYPTTSAERQTCLDSITALGSSIVAPSTPYPDFEGLSIRYADPTDKMFDYYTGGAVSYTNPSPGWMTWVLPIDPGGVGPSMDTEYHSWAPFGFTQPDGVGDWPNMWWVSPFRTVAGGCTGLYPSSYFPIYCVSMSTYNISQWNAGSPSPTNDMYIFPSGATVKFQIRIKDSTADSLSYLFNYIGLSMFCVTYENGVSYINIAGSRIAV